MSTFAFAENLTKSEISFNFGPSLSQNGNISDLGDPTVNTGFDFNYFFTDVHGLGVSYSNEFEFDGSSKFPLIEDGSISTWSLHYAFRLPLSEKFRLLITPGFGLQTLYDKTGDYYWGYVYNDDLSHSWVFDYKITGQLYLGEAFFIGAGIIHIFSLEDDYKGRDITGDRLSGLVHIGIGY